MTITVNINGKKLRLNIENSEEEDFREAGTLVNQLIESYHNRFNTMSSEDILTRVAYDLAVNLIQAEKRYNRIESMDF